MKKVSISVMVLTFFLTSSFVAFGQSEVSVYPQPDSPLLLSSAIPNWHIYKDDKDREWNRLAIEYVIQNISDKPIRAYTIRQFEGDFNQDIGMTQFCYFSTSNGFFKPNQLRSEDIGGSGYLKIPPSIKLAVDFVEFNDGSTWGNDASKSAERLAGTRAGAASSLENLNKINRQNGIEAVIKTLDEAEITLPPAEKSEIWKNGFKSGAGSIKFIVKHAYEEQGKKGAEAKLQNLIDTSSSN